MELRQLAYLVAVAEAGSFTRAAERLHVAQPGVSAQIRKLEAELGEALLDRSGGRVRPTAVGAAVLPYARAALDAVAGARGAVEELAGLVRGRVAIGVVTAGSGVDLAELLAAFHRRHPGVEVTLTEGRSAQLAEALRAGELDVGLIAVAGEAPPGLAVHVIDDQPLVAAVMPSHPLARRRSVPLAALADHPLIATARGTGMRTLLERACAAAGVRLRVALEAGDPNLLARLAARGLGVAILPRALAEAHGPALRAVPLDGPPLRGAIALAWRATAPLSPAARAFVAHARSTLAPPAPPPAPPPAAPPPGAPGP